MSYFTGFQRALGLLVLCGVVVAVWFWGDQWGDAPAAASANLEADSDGLIGAFPTLEPLQLEPVCTDRAVQLWWQSTSILFLDWQRAAEQAMNTRPSVRLDRQLAGMHRFRQDFPPVPACASDEVKSAAQAILGALDATLVVVQDWADDGHVFNPFGVEPALADLMAARVELSRLIPALP